MTDWQKTKDHITFEGKNEVLSRIDALEQEERGPFTKFMAFLDSEILIPTKGLVVGLALFVLVVGLRWSHVPDAAPTYPIAVINERGFHEKIY